jgi:hypothetical protein
LILGVDRKREGFDRGHMQGLDLVDLTFGRFQRPDMVAVHPHAGGDEQSGARYCGGEAPSRRHERRRDAERGNSDDAGGPRQNLT